MIILFFLFTSFLMLFHTFYYLFFLLISRIIWYLFVLTSFFCVTTYMMEWNSQNETGRFVPDPFYVVSHLTMSSEIGIYGLTSQGINLALNFASKGYLVTVGNKSSDKVWSLCLHGFYIIDQGMYRFGRKRRLRREGTWN